MRKKIYLATVMIAALTLSGCSLDTQPYDEKDETKAYTNLNDIRNGMNGAYNNLGDYEFLGRDAVIVGDMLSGVSLGNAESGYFDDLSGFSFSDTEDDIENIWTYGYRVANGAATTISNAKKLMANGDISDDDYGTAYSYIGQCYAMKALAFYYLVNYFALPYSSANASTPGIVTYDLDVPQPKAQVKRGTVQQAYDQIVNDMDSAEANFDKAGDEAPTSAFYIGPMGLKALEARVYMSLGDYKQAEDAAKEALSLKDAGDGTADDDDPSDDAYINMWGGTIETDEDLFAIKKADDDNLSANSLNNAYSDYYCTFQNAALDKLGENDIRRQLLRDGNDGGTSSIKYDGKSSLTVSNIPIFRKSEMSLIIAECEARTGSLDEARNYLMYTAKRNPDITSVDDLPQTREELLQFIYDERVREFFGEGHRFFDARRTGERISGDRFSNWDISKFVLPIPASEINSGWGVTQNENWSDNFPSISDDEDDDDE